MIKINGKVIEHNHFPDGTTLMKYKSDESFKYSSCVPSVDIEWFFENNEELVQLIYLVKHLRNHGIKEISLIMPYIPNARQDRVKNEEDVFTLKYFCEVINWLDFYEVIVHDPHSSVSAGLINNLYIVDTKYYILKAISFCTPNMVFYPDEGSMKRYSGSFKSEYAFGIKRREWKTGEIEGLDIIGPVEKIKGSKILIVDDICSRGGTFLHSAKKLKELGAKEIYLYVTHCENTILEGELLTSGLIEKVYTTNSIFTKEHEKIEVFKI